MVIPTHPDISHLPHLTGKNTLTKNGTPVLQIAVDQRDLPSLCDQTPPCTDLSCPHTDPMTHAHRAMTLAGWQMHSGNASQGAVELRRYRPPALSQDHSPQHPPEPPDTPESPEQNPTQPLQSSLWPH